jgi:hypothetical protein
MFIRRYTDVSNYSKVIRENYGTEQRTLGSESQENMDNLEAAAFIRICRNDKVLTREKFGKPRR